MRKITFILVTVSLLITNFVQAQEKTTEKATADCERNWQVRLRGIGIYPDQSATIGIIGGDIAISNAYVPELDFTYFFTEHFAAELILGTAKHDVKAINTAAGDVDLGSVLL